MNPSTDTPTPPDVVAAARTFNDTAGTGDLCVSDWLAARSASGTNGEPES